MTTSIRLKYLIANDNDISWGLKINTIGFQFIDKNQHYPQGDHPTRYLFSTDKGRILNEYQLLYITRGQGTFISKQYKHTNVKAGTMFLLFPGEWHNYMPDKKTGWNEYWIGFEGSMIDNLVDKDFLNVQRPIFNVGVSEDIITLYNNAATVAADQSSGYQQILAGITNYLISIAYFRDRQSQFEDKYVVNQINMAKGLMLENLKIGITLEGISEQLNVSYSWFRRIFKQYTGLSPHQYILELRIQKSKELLTNTSLTGQEISFEAGFENSDYFSHAFKKRTGMSPMKYREFTQGKNL